MQTRVLTPPALSSPREALAIALLAPAAPLMLLQGRRVRRDALRLPEAAGQREGQGPADRSSDKRLLIVGDSSAAGVGVSNQSQALSGQLVEALALAGVAPRRWQLIARTGAAAADLPALLERGLPADSSASSRFDVALVVVGVNDVTRATPIPRWLADLDRIHEQLRGLGVAVTLFSGLPPMERFTALPQPLRSWLGLQARRYDRALGHWSQTRPGALHQVLPRLDDPALLASDGFHPGEAGCAVWAQALALRLTSIFIPDQSAASAFGSSRFAPDSSIAT